MTITELNDAAILRQVDGQWQKIAMILLYKFKGREMVKITADDIQAATKAFAPSMPVMFIHGHRDGFDLQVVDVEAANRIAAHEASMRGAGNAH